MARKYGCSRKMNRSTNFINDQHVSTERCLVCDALKDSVHLLENGGVYVLLY